MRHPDEGRIHAWLDGALGAEQSRAIEEHVTRCEACAARVADARGLIAASSRILSALDKVPAGVVPVVHEAPAAPRARATRHAARWAAMVGFLGLGTLVATRVLNRHEEAATRIAARPTATPAPAPSSPMAAASAQPSEDRSRAENDSLARSLRQAAQLETTGKRLMASVATIATDSVAAREAPPPVHAEADTMAWLRDVRFMTPAADVASSAKARVTLEPVTVTGMRAAPAPQLIAADTIRRNGRDVRRSTYVTPSHRRVTLEASPEPIEPDTAAMAGHLTADTTRTLNVLRWQGSDGTYYVLWGPATTQELERIRAQVTP